MAYSTVALVRTASGFSNTTKFPTASIEAYLADADSVINAYIADRYALPLSSTPEIIETLARFITVGFMYAQEYGEESEDTDKGWQKRLDWAMAQLEKIQKGELKLYDSSGVELTRSELKLPVFSPNDASSAVDAEDSDASKLTMNQKF